MKGKSDFLDMGSGSSDLTKSIAFYFQSMTVIDEKRIFEKIYEEQGFDYYIGDFMKYNLVKKFDFERL